jgi:hypothetical protein
LKENHNNFKSRSGSHSGLDASIHAKKQALKISCDSPFIANMTVSVYFLLFYVLAVPCGGKFTKNILKFDYPIVKIRTLSGGRLIVPDNQIIIVIKRKRFWKIK